MTPDDRRSVRIVIAVVVVAVLTAAGLFVCAPWMDHHAEVLAVRRALPAGHRLGLNDLAPVERSRDVKDAFTAGHAATLVGKTLSRDVDAGQVLTHQDLSAAPLPTSQGEGVR